MDLEQRRQRKMRSMARRNIRVITDFKLHLFFFCKQYETKLSEFIAEGSSLKKKPEDRPKEKVERSKTVSAGNKNIIAEPYNSNSFFSTKKGIINVAGPKNRIEEPAKAAKKRQRKPRDLSEVQQPVMPILQNGLDNSVPVSVYEGKIYDLTMTCAFDSLYQLLLAGCVNNCLMRSRVSFE